MTFKPRIPFKPSRGQPYDRRIYRPRKGEPKTSLKIVTIFTPFRLRLLDLIRGHPGVSYWRLAALAKRPPTAVRDNLRTLIQARLVHVVKEPWRNYIYLNGVKHPRDVRPPPWHGRYGAPRGVVPLGETMRRVYEYLVLHEDATRQQVIRELGLSRHQALRALAQIEKRGIVTQLRRVTLARLVRPAREEELELLAGGIKRRAQAPRARAARGLRA